MSRFWKQWLVITKKISSWLAIVALTIVYFIIIVPIGLLFRAFYKEQLLGYGNKVKRNSYWIKKMDIKRDMKWAKEQ